jgi:molybdopterin molybdotransferase
MARRRRRGGSPLIVTRRCDVLSFAEALKRVLDGVEPLGGERLGLRSAAGRVLARDLIAETPLPRFDHSAMDGYAVRGSDFVGSGPWHLPVRGESRAGRDAPSLEPASACRIFTGAALPLGADAVITQEDTRVTGDLAVFEAAPRPHQHVRRRGEDLSLGGLALRAGTRLGAHHLGLAAALDQVDVLVARRPRVSIVCTGDELRAAGRSGSSSSIPESNGLCVALEAERVGALAELAELATDDAAATTSALRALLGTTDLLITIGGVSVGDYDVVRPALESAGAHIDFWKVQIKPGKPLAYGRCGKTRILGLPGNPVSAQLTFALFGLPLLRALQGQRNPAPQLRPMRLLAELRQKPGRMGFYRGRSCAEGVVPLDNQASGNVVSLSEADTLIAVPADSSGFGAGDLVDVLRLDEL